MPSAAVARWRDRVVDAQARWLQRRSEEKPAEAMPAPETPVKKADKAAGRITPGMESFVKMVNGIIKEEMMPKIEAGHKSAVGMLASIHSGFEGCGTHRSVAKAAIATLSTTKTSARNSHTTCRVKESAAYVDRAQCFAVVKEKMRLRDIACKAYKQMLKNPDDDADNCHTSASAEPYGAWLKRNRNWFEQNAQDRKASCRERV